MSSTEWGGGDRRGSRRRNEHAETKGEEIRETKGEEIREIRIRERDVRRAWCDAALT